MTSPKTQDSIFLAHTREDKPFVRLLYKKLKHAGLNPWLDEECIPLSALWEDEIEKAIRSCRIFLACISRNSVSKDGYVQKELTLALAEAEKKANLQYRLIPVQLDDVEIPRVKVGMLELRQFQAISISSERGMERLISELRTLITTVAKNSHSVQDFVKLTSLLATGTVEDVLTKLPDLIHPSDKTSHNTIIMLRADWAQLEEDQIKNVIPYDRVTVEKARIRQGVLRVIDKAEMSFKN